MDCRMSTSPVDSHTAEAKQQAALTEATRSDGGLGRVLGAEVDGAKAIEELRFGQPEGSAVGRPGGAARLPHRRVLVPAWAAVGPLRRPELGLAPEVADLHEVQPRASRVALAGEDRTGAPIHDATCVLDLGSGPGAAAHGEILVIPSAHPLEHLFSAQHPQQQKGEERTTNNEQALLHILRLLQYVCALESLCFYSQTL